MANKFGLMDSLMGTNLPVSPFFNWIGDRFKGGVDEEFDRLKADPTKYWAGFAGGMSSGMAASEFDAVPLAALLQHVGIHPSIHHLDDEIISALGGAGLDQAKDYMGEHWPTFDPTPEYLSQQHGR